jgi:hypothetical protein
MKTEEELQQEQQEQAQQRFQEQLMDVLWTYRSLLIRSFREGKRVEVEALPESTLVSLYKRNLNETYLPEGTTWRLILTTLGKAVFYQYQDSREELEARKLNASLVNFSNDILKRLVNMDTA